MRELPPADRRVVLPLLLLMISLLVLGAEVTAYRRHLRQPAVAGEAAAQTIPQMLTLIAAHLDPQAVLYMNATRAALLGAQLKAPDPGMSPIARVKVEAAFADELLKAGKTEQALREYHLVERQIQTNAPPALWRQARSYLLTQEAIGYLRLGEQQNCCASNNAYSCLLPIIGPGIHTKQYGSRNAIRCLTEVLHGQPGDLQARWLLNIAYMTVGGYPKDVPPGWLIPLRDLGSAPMKRFYNAAPQLGLDLLGLSGSVAMEDFEGNGLLDLLISSTRPDGQLRYFRNNGDGTFTERTQQAGLIGETGGLNLITTDYNNDGRPDVVVLRGAWLGHSGHFPLSLLRNDGGGHFTDITIQAGLLTLGPTQTAVALDYDGDGWLDLFVGYESTPGDPVPCKLFRNNGDGTFTDVAPRCGLNLTRYVKAAVSADYTHSGRPGLYLSCAGQPNILLRNDGPAGPDHSPGAPWKFTDVSRQSGTCSGTGTFSCFFFDYDNDGWPDLYVGGWGKIRSVGDIAADYLGLPTPAAKSHLYRNNHNGTFTDVSKQAHLDKVIEGMGINYGDLDNDGWLDFYVGTGTPDLETLVPNRMFRNHDGRDFEEVTTTGGFGHLQKGHGIAFGDLDNSGQQDVFEVMGGAYQGDTAHDCLYVNPGSAGHWVTLKLEGVRSSRIALGAEICVTAATPHGERNVYRTVSTGGSFGANPLRQEVGLGDATAVRGVRVRWPGSGAMQVVRGVGLDGFYRVREGDPVAHPWRVPHFHLPSRPGGTASLMSGMAMK